MHAFRMPHKTQNSYFDRIRTVLNVHHCHTSLPCLVSTPGGLVRCCGRAQLPGRWAVAARGATGLPRLDRAAAVLPWWRLLEPSRGRAVPCGLWARREVQGRGLGAVISAWWPGDRCQCIRPPGPPSTLLDGAAAGGRTAGAGHRARPRAAARRQRSRCGLHQVRPQPDLARSQARRGGGLRGLRGGPQPLQSSTEENALAEIQRCLPDYYSLRVQQCRHLCSCSSILDSRQVPSSIVASTTAGDGGGWAAFLTCFPACV